MTNTLAGYAAAAAFLNGLFLGAICISISATLENQAKIMRHRNG